MNLILNGMRVVISARTQRMVCSESFERIQSADLVRETNQWMAKFFGYKNDLPGGEIIQYRDECLIMNQKTYDTAREALSRAAK